MKRLFLVLFGIVFLGLCVLVLAEEPYQVQWVRQMGSCYCNDSGTGVAADSFGSVYLASSYYKTKYDANGNLVWNIVSKMTGNLWAISVDSSGMEDYVYTAGYKMFNSPTTPTIPYFGAIVEKLRTDGTLIWHKEFLGPNYKHTFAYDIKVDSAGNVCVAGLTEDSLACQNFGGMDIFVSKLDADGNVIWSDQFGSTNYESIPDIAIDSFNRIYIVATTSGDVLPQSPPNLNEDYVVRKYGPSGSIEWTKQFGGYYYGQSGRGIVADQAGYIYVCGQQAPELKCFIRKYAEDGTEVQSILHGPTPSAFNDITIGEGGRIYATGAARPPGSTNNDILVSKFNTNLEEIWTMQFGTSMNDHSIDIAANSFGVYVSGITWGALEGQGPNAETDPFVAKLVPSNNPPTANAGADQIIEATGPTTSITLNGSDSSDPDDDILTYKWEEGEGNVVGDSVSVTLDRKLGTFTFTLTVTDPDGLNDSDTVSITVHDTTPPSLTAPADVTVDQSNPYGTPVTLGNPTVSDLCDPSPTVVNNAPALYPLGQTAVTWTAKDASGNIATAQQKVTVVPGSPANQLSNLTKLVEYSVAAGTIDPELETSLLAKVAAASDALAKANPNAATVAMNDLKALVNQVEAQADKKITPAIAAQIIAWANGIITSLGV